MITERGTFKVVGYGPSGLLKKVKEAKWVCDTSIGNHFEGIRFGNQARALFEKDDEVCWVPLVVTITGEGDAFDVFGWTNPDAVFVAIAASEKRSKGSKVLGINSNWGGSIKLSGTILAKHPTSKKMVPYEIEIDLD